MKKDLTKELLDAVYNGRQRKVLTNKNFFKELLMKLFKFLRFGCNRNRISRKKPFMEHPTGKYDKALFAIESAINDLFKLEKWDKWITFSGQGQGASNEAYHIEEVHMLKTTFDIGDRKVDLNSVLQFAGLHSDNLSITVNNGKISIPGATPNQLARFLDAIFQKGLGVCPFEDEDDYAVGAEWL